MTTEIALPVFNFTAPVTVSDADAAVSLNADQITPYTEVVLECLKIEWRGTSEKDNTWGSFQMFFGLPGTVLDAEGKGKTADGKFAPVIRHFLTVPLTSKNLYNEETAPRMADRLVKFLQAAGETNVSIGNYGDAVTRRFSGTGMASWKGFQANCFVGYSKEHIAKDGGKFFIADKKGKPFKGLTNNSFLQREQAEGAAIKYGIDTDKSFLNIIRITALGTSTTPVLAAEIAAEVDSEEY